MIDIYRHRPVWSVHNQFLSSSNSLMPQYTSFGVMWVIISKISRQQSGPIISLYRCVNCSWYQLTKRTHSFAAYTYSRVIRPLEFFIAFELKKKNRIKKSNGQMRRLCKVNFLGLRMLFLYCEVNISAYSF